MPKRQATRKADTPKEIMGEGAFVEYRSFTMQEQRDLRETAKEYQDTIDEHIEKYAISIDKKVSELTEEEKNKAISSLENADELTSYTDKVYASRIVNWNWVDDNDKELPIPSQDENWIVMRTLYSHEYEYLQELLVPKENTEKK